MVTQSLNTPRQPVDEMCASMFIKAIAAQRAIGCVTRAQVTGTHHDRVRDGQHGPLLATTSRAAMIEG
jgi:hypothetical protein